MASETDTIRRRKATLAPLTDFEREIVARARSFDVIALVDLLQAAGYLADDMVFESHFSQATQVGLVEKVQFLREPVRQVIVSLNAGLLSADSPLPSYFLKLIEGGDIDEEPFLGFLRFFDHHLLRNFLFSIYPEQDRTIYRDWERTKRSYLMLLGLRSTSTLHWLFASVYPELGVAIERMKFGRDVVVTAARLGQATLGGPWALGAKSSVPVMGYAVTLTCEEELTDWGRPWAEEARRRLEATIFPVLREADVELQVRLVIRSQKGFAKLKQGSYLGYDRVRGGEARHRLIVIHKGRVPDAPRPDVPPVETR